MYYFAKSIKTEKLKGKKIADKVYYLDARDELTTDVSKAVASLMATRLRRCAEPDRIAQPEGGWVTTCTTAA